MIYWSQNIVNRDFARDVGGSNENEAAAMLVYRYITKMAESRTENTAENLANEKKGNSCSSIELKLSEYARKLDDHVKRRYMEKISVIGVDPCLIPEEKFNPEVLPPVEATDLLSYLVLDSSFYTKQQFKSFRSLNAYN